MSSPCCYRIPPPFIGRSIVGVSDFDRPALLALFETAEFMRALVEGGASIKLANGCILATLFYEPSTRTSSSFQAAMIRLGGSTIHVDANSSSATKGESLEDTVRTLQTYADVIVLRHPLAGSALTASRVVSIPLINGGDGVGDHPTQALLDVFTLHSEFSFIDGLVVTLVGDLKHGRTVHSLVKVLLNFRLSRLNLIAPAQLALPREILQLAKQAGIPVFEGESIEEVLPETDVLYMTRLQRERFPDFSSFSSFYEISLASLKAGGAKASMRILHPMPRVNEIHKDLDEDPRAAYFRQMRCGLFIRMALLAWVLGKAPEAAENSVEKEKTETRKENQ